MKLKILWRIGEWYYNYTKGGVGGCTGHRLQGPHTIINYKKQNNIA